MTNLLFSKKYICKIFGTGNRKFNGNDINSDSYHNDDLMMTTVKA